MSALFSGFFSYFPCTRVTAFSRTSLFSLLADTVAGLEVIRSSEMEDAFLKKFYRSVIAISISAFSPKSLSNQSAKPTDLKMMIFAF